MNAEPQSESKAEFEDKMLRWAGAFFIFTLGMIHLLQSEEFFTAATYVGALALINFFAACGAAMLLARSGSRGAWLFGAAIAGGSLVLLLISRTIGLQGHEEVIGQWLNFPAWYAIAAELAYLALCAAALRRGAG